jgi:proteasome lid subunit RPN8/RPN11
MGALMIEVAMVFDKKGNALFWLGPKEHTSSYIPDSQVMWQRIWEHRDIIGGVVHTHPWNGAPFPSETDTTTWHAIERALGKKLIWPIVSMDDVTYFRRFQKDGVEFYQAVNFKPKNTTHWMKNVIELRRLSSQ